MPKTPYILMIAPSAPPRKSAESIQVGRILAALDQQASGKLITIPADEYGWSTGDTSLTYAFKNFERQELKLPLHALMTRLLSSHRFGWLHVPDAQFWVAALDKQVTRNLTRKPDVIYSRSTPMSAALLARKLKHTLQVPWIMHLSDPWADSPYKETTKQNTAIEAACFKDADAIALTTQGQADYYRSKYPAYESKIFVSPNVMPAIERTDMLPTGDAILRIVFTGNLYSIRSPKPLTDAIALLKAHYPALIPFLRIDFYGHIQQALLPLIQQHPDIVHYHGSVPYAQAIEAQRAADILLTIEADSDAPLIKATLLSKVTDYLAMGKPIFAITPKGSETEAICNSGYGWAVSPSQPHALAEQLADLIRDVASLRARPAKAPPECYMPSFVVTELLACIHRLSKGAD